MRFVGFAENLAGLPRPFLAANTRYITLQLLTPTLKETEKQKLSCEMSQLVKLDCSTLNFGEECLLLAK